MKKLLILVAALSLVACSSNTPKDDASTPATNTTTQGTTQAVTTDGTEQTVTTEGTTEAITTQGTEQAVTTEGTSEAVTTEETSVEAQTYTIVKGDNLFRIGLNYNMSWETLATENNISDANVITEGTVLTIPTTK